MRLGGKCRGTPCAGTPAGRAGDARDARTHVRDADLTSFSEFTGGRLPFAGQDARHGRLA